MQKFKIRSLLEDIDNLSFKGALEYIEEKAREKEKKTFVVTINTEILMIARSDPEYEQVMKSADLALAESVGVVWGGQVFRKPFKDRIPGADLMQKLCERVAKQPITVGFLGGKQNVAEQTAKCLQKKYPGLKVAFAIEEWPLDGKGLASDILFVAFGSPKQEEWIHENLSKLNVRVAIGVGGAFDFVSGGVPRAPKFVRSIGLEWLFRLFIQPWRIKRQSALIYYVLLVVKEKLGF
ncbi:MAG: hypothetical protein ACD_37C00210G0003 [uncultured bacterium]|nr:MAG: hypothetical protein ACD_37C00210G0003 [uncultured bacterium]